MILTCNACSTRYFVEPNHIGNTGRKVRCSRCKHMWVIEPLNDNKSATVKTPPKTVKPLPKGSALPVIQHTRKLGSMIVKATILLGLLNLIAGTIFLLYTHQFGVIPGFEKISTSIATYSSHGLVLSNVSIQSSKEGKQFGTLSISNTTKISKAAPHITLLFVNKQGQKVGAISPSLKGSIAPHKTVTVKFPVAIIPNHADAVTVSIDNSLITLIKDML